MSEKTNDPAFTFIDLFAGIGGFHQAMEKLGGKCVFASELKPDLQKLYKENFDIECAGDINDINIQKDIPKHTILCAGFPCQPFSKAGKQQGFNDEHDRGNLFWKIMEILEAKKPEFILLENVQNLETHDNCHTWEVIKENLSKLYEVDCKILSPHDFGIPQHRKRIYIVGHLKSKGGLKGFSFPEIPNEKPVCSITSIVDETETRYKHLQPQTRIHLEAWQHFLDILTEHNVEIPSFPIWAMEWGADYDYDPVPPCHQSEEDLHGKKGKFGKKIKDGIFDEMLEQLPIYAQVKIEDPDEQFPDWKKNFIKWNREFYEKNKKILDPWLPEIKQQGFENSHQKFEWNCGKDKNARPTLDDKIIQFRPSGIRVKLPTYSPALVLTSTQIPIFPWVNTPDGEHGRYMTTKEAAKLQCMELKKYPNTMGEAFKAFGNAVNVEVVKRIAEKLLEIRK